MRLLLVTIITMKNYIGIYFASAAQLKEWENMSKEDQNTGMDEWNTWMATHKNDMADPGAPLGKTKRVAKSGVSDIKNEICGYTIVKADSHEAAAQIFADSPHLNQGDTWVEVIECLEMP